MENKWYQHSGPEGDVVISTRVRLARNIENYPFPGSMEPEQRRQVMDIFKRRPARCGLVPWETLRRWRRSRWWNVI